MEYPERTECDFSTHYWEIVDTTPLREAKKLREQELLEFIEENQVEEVREFVMDAIRELLKLK